MFRSVCRALTRPLLAVLIVAAPFAPAAAQRRPTVDATMRQLEGAQPLLATLRETEPAAYGRIRTLVADTLASNRFDRNAMAREIRAIITAVVVRRSPTASDEHMGELIAVAAGQAASLESRPQVCADLLGGRAGDVASLLPPDLVRRELALYERLLRQPPLENPPILDDAQFGAEMRRLVPDLMRTTGLEQADLFAAMQGQGRPETVCRVGRAFMDALLAMEPARRAALYRRLLSAASAAAR